MAIQLFYEWQAIDIGLFSLLTKGQEKRQKSLLILYFIITTSPNLASVFAVHFGCFANITLPTRYSLVKVPSCHMQK